MPIQLDAVYQEQVNKRVLQEYVRIVGLKFKKNSNYDVVLSEFADKILEYPKELGKPFTWPTSAGQTAEGPAIRAKISYQFWTFFTREGRRRLYEYNRKEKTNIKIIKDKTKTLEEVDKLGLYIRKTLKNLEAPVEVAIVKGRLKIGNHENLRPTTAAIRLDIDMSEWRGVSIEEIMTKQELEDLKAGRLIRGDIKIPGLKTNKPKPTEKEKAPATDDSGVVKKRKRVSESRLEL